MPGYPMQAGFDQSSLMSDPKLKQQETMNQGNMVSAPYFQANKMAAEKPSLWLAVKKVTVLTSKGPRNEVNLPDVANKPNPLP